MSRTTIGSTRMSKIPQTYGIRPCTVLKPRRGCTTNPTRPHCRSKWSLIRFRFCDGTYFLNLIFDGFAYRLITFPPAIVPLFAGFLLLFFYAITGIFRQTPKLERRCFAFGFVLLPQASSAAAASTTCIYARDLVLKGGTIVWICLFQLAQIVVLALLRSAAATKMRWIFLEAIVSLARLSEIVAVLANEDHAAHFVGVASGSRIQRFASEYALTIQDHAFRCCGDSTIVQVVSVTDIFFLQQPLGFCRTGKERHCCCSSSSRCHPIVHDDSSGRPVCRCCCKQRDASIVVIATVRGS